MQFAKLWQCLRSSHKCSRNPIRSRRCGAQLALEELEKREVPAVLVLDLVNMQGGNDGRADTIEARRHGSKLELVVNGEITHSKSLAKLTGLKILGSADADNIFVVSDLGLDISVDCRGGTNVFTLRGTKANERIGVTGRITSIAVDPGIDNNRPDVNDIYIFQSPTNPGTGNHHTITLMNVSSATIEGNAGNDELTILDSMPSIPISFLGGSGFNKLVGIKGQPNYFVISGAKHGSLNQTTAFTGVESLHGGNLNDEFRFSSPTFSNLVMADGHGGEDTLDFTTIASPAVVNLAAGTATGIARGIRGIENVRGGSGDDILIGNSSANHFDGGEGNDVLIGGIGQDVLIGGAGNDILLGGEGNDYIFGGAGFDIMIGNTGGDRLDGGDGDDLLIGGSTTFDRNLPALNVIRAIWSNPIMTYQERINELQKVGTGTIVLNNSNVIRDWSSDWLSGGTGQDWFWPDRLDYIF